MRNSWDELVTLLPGRVAWERYHVEFEKLMEIRLRVGACVELNYGHEQKYLPERVTGEDLAFIINAVTRYSPWQAETMAQGYLTTKGGCRIGICGEAVIHAGQIRGIRNPESLCIRIARDVEGIGEPFRKIRESLLLIGPPGSGKTTLLRDIARVLSEQETVVVLDEREELFPDGFRRGKRMDVLRLCSKAEGMDMVVRTMGPEWVCLDEITREKDACALMRAANCGVRFLATAHAFDLQELEKRWIYRKILDNGIFENIVALRKQRALVWERKEAWL